MKKRVRVLEQRMVTRELEIPDDHQWAEGVRLPKHARAILASLCEHAIEEVWAIHLDGRHRYIAAHCVSRGTPTSSLILPSVILRAAITSGAVALILAHNHPSGDCTPSIEDINVTERMFKACSLIGITFLDHLVVGDSTHLSIRATNPGAFCPQ